MRFLILLMFPFALSGQFVAKHNGDVVTSGGASIRVRTVDIPVSPDVPPTPEGKVVLWTSDFESWTNGSYDTTQLHDDFYLHPTMTASSGAAPNPSDQLYVGRTQVAGMASGKVLVTTLPVTSSNQGTQFIMELMPGVTDTITELYYEADLAVRPESHLKIVIYL